MMRFFATLLLYGLPGIVLPFGTSWHEIPKILLTHVVVLSLSVVFFWREERWTTLRIKPIAKLLLAGLFAHSLLGLLTSWTPTLFFGNSYRMQGTLLLWTLLLWCIISPSLVWERGQRLLAALVLTATLCTAVLGSVDASSRAVGLIGEANALGAHTLFFAALTHHALAMIPTLGVLFLSGSKSALLGLGVMFAVFLGYRLLSLRIAAVVGALILLLAMFLPLFDRHQVFESRIDIWQTALAAGLRKPVLGWGVGNIEVGLQQAGQDTQSAVRFQYVDSSHHLFLDWWVQGGAVGLILFAGLFLTALLGLIKQHDMISVAALFGILSVMLFNPVSVAILVPFWWILGKGIRD